METGNNNRVEWRETLPSPGKFSKKAEHCWSHTQTGLEEDAGAGGW